MRVKKKVQGVVIDLDIVLVKKYPRFGLYQIYKIDKGKQIPLYKECFTSEQINEIINKKYIITEEVFIWSTG